MLKDVSFTAEENEISGLLGPSGAGQTTLINIIGGKLKSDGGDVKICGYTQDSMSKCKSLFGVVEQEESLSSCCLCTTT